MHASYVLRAQIPDYGDPSNISLVSTQDQALCVFSGGIIMKFRCEGLVANMRNSILQAHQGDLLAVRTHAKILVTVDMAGLMCNWELVGKTWELGNSVSRKNTLVKDVRISPDERMIAAGYDDGSLIFYSPQLALGHSADFENEILLLDWAPDGKTLLVGFRSSPHVKMVGSDGMYLSTIATPCLEGAAGHPVSLEHCPGGGRAGSFVIAFSCGRAQLMASPWDEDPAMIDCESTLLEAKWNPSGTVIVFCCPGKIVFFNKLGENVARVPEANSFGPIKSLVWDSDGGRLFVSSGKEIATMRISNDIDKGFLQDACVILEPNSGTVCIIKELGGEVIRVAVPSVLGLSCWGGDTEFAIMSCSGLSILNQSGVVLKQLRMRAMSLLSHRGAYTVAGGSSNALIWNWMTGDVLTVNAEMPFIVKRYDPNKIDWEGAVDDKFVAISMGGSTLTLARESGVIHVISISLKQVSFVGSVTVPTSPEKLFLNCDDSTAAVIDINNCLFLVNLDPGTSTRTSRTDCWDIVWSLDDPCMLACIDRHKLYVLRDNKPEEPVDIGGDILVGLDQLVTTTLRACGSGTFTVNRFPCKALRDLCEIIYTVGNVNDGFEFALRNPHPKLWETIAEGALLQDPMRLDLAETAFNSFLCNDGTVLVKTLREETDAVRQRMLALVWFGRLKECDIMLNSINRKDLLIEQKTFIHDLDSLVALDATLDLQVLGDHFFENARYSHAAKCYVKGRLACENSLSALLIDNNFGDLVKSIEFIEAGNPILSQIADVLTVSGLCEEAVRFYLKSGHPDRAIAACVKLERWDLVSSLEARIQPPNRPDTVEAKALQLMKERKFGDVLDLIKHGFAVQLLKNLFENSIYVDPKVSVGPKKKAAVLFAVLNSSSESSHEPLVWRQSEVFHLFNLLLEHFHSSRYRNAIACGLRLSSFDEDMRYIPKQEVWRIVALAALFEKEIQVCSSAFIQLEIDSSITPQKRELYKRLAAEIFDELKVTEGVSKGNKSCSNCTKTDLPDFATCCDSCGQELRFCASTGQPVFRDDSTRVCVVCSSTIIIKYMTHTACPLCHTRIN